MRGAGIERVTGGVDTTPARGAANVAGGGLGIEVDRVATFEAVDGDDIFFSGLAGAEFCVGAGCACRIGAAIGLLCNDGCFCGVAGALSVRLPPYVV